jgi:hypothetical protein
MAWRTVWEVDFSLTTCPQLGDRVMDDQNSEFIFGDSWQHLAQGSELADEIAPCKEPIHTVGANVRIAVHKHKADLGPII